MQDSGWDSYFWSAVPTASQAGKVLLHSLQCRRAATNSCSYISLSRAFQSVIQYVRWRRSATTILKGAGSPQGLLRPSPALPLFKLGLVPSSRLVCATLGRTIQRGDTSSDSNSVNGLPSVTLRPSLTTRAVSASEASLSSGAGVQGSCSQHSPTAIRRRFVDGEKCISLPRKASSSMASGCLQMPDSSETAGATLQARLKHLRISPKE